MPQDHEDRSQQGVEELLLQYLRLSEKGETGAAEELRARTSGFVRRRFEELLAIHSNLEGMCKEVARGQQPDARLAPPSSETP